MEEYENIGIGWAGLDWMDLVQGRDKVQAFSVYSNERSRFLYT
jgi:hypothetical protein